MIINKIKYSVIALASALTMTSCQDYLTTPSESSLEQGNFYTSEGNIDRGLIGVYGCLKPFSTYYFEMSELRSDNMFIQVESKKNEFADCSQLNSTNLLNDNVVYNCWADHYKLIVAANQLIDNINNITYSNEGAATQYEAEARFLRGLAYFDLVRYYGNVPVSLHTLTIDESFDVKQSEPKDVYLNAILPDLYYAANNLQATATDYNKVTKEERVKKIAAKAMLAKAYMYMYGYPVKATKQVSFEVNGETVTISNLKTAAKDLLEEVLVEAGCNPASVAEDGTSGAPTKYWATTSEEWNNMWFHENDNKYFLFEIQYACEKDNGNPMTPLTKQANTSQDKFNGANLTSGPHAWVDRVSILPYFNLNSADGRKIQSLNTFGSSGDDESGEVVNESNVFMPKFIEHKLKRKKFNMSDMDATIIDRTYWPQNFPIIRLEECMLLYAECVGRKAGKGLLNLIHRRATGKAVTNIDTEVEFQIALTQERRYEQIGEGVRWFEMIRQNTDDTQYNNSETPAKNYSFVKLLRYKWSQLATILSNENYTIYSTRANEYSKYYPIPLSQMRVRDGLYKQNDGY